jgi:hypothetical protein
MTVISAPVLVVEVVPDVVQLAITSLASVAGLLAAFFAWRSARASRLATENASSEQASLVFGHASVRPATALDLEVNSEITDYVVLNIWNRSGAPIGRPFIRAVVDGEPVTDNHSYLLIEGGAESGEDLHPSRVPLAGEQPLAEVWFMDSRGRKWQRIGMAAPKRVKKYYWEDDPKFAALARSVR